MNKIDNRLIAGILLIAFALMAIVLVLLFMRQGNGSSGLSSDANSTAKTIAEGSNVNEDSESSEPSTQVKNDSENGSETVSEQSPSSFTTDNWVNYVNSIRASAGIPPITEDSGLSNAANLHAMYVVANNRYSHEEDPSLPKYTVEGDQAARDGLIFATSNTSAGYQESIGFWASGPFHLVPLLNPRLDKMGYSTFVDTGSSNTKMSGILNLGPRATHGANKDVYPAMYPGDGQTTAVLSQRIREWPDATMHCGYSRPVGAPIVLMIGSGNQTPNVGNYSVTQNGSAIDVCMVNETNFSHSDSYEQSVGRVILNSLDAIVLVPRAPMQPDAAYTVNLEVNGVAHNWTFNTR